MAAFIDTHALIKDLTSDGTLSEHNAETLANAVNRALEGQVATKQDLLVTASDLRAALSETKVQMILAMVGVGVIQTGLISALVLKLVH